MEKRLHYWLPNWAHEALNKRCCSQCNTKYSKLDVVAIGIRETEQYEYTMYVEHECSKCDHRALTTLTKHKATSLEEICFLILENIKRKKTSLQRRLVPKKKKGPMTDGEVAKFMDFVNTSETHADFMKEIGLPTQEPKDDTS